MKSILLCCTLCLISVCSFAQQFAISSYIRGNFYNRGAITEPSLRACTDLICLGVSPAQDGTLVWDEFKTFQANQPQDVKALIPVIQAIVQQQSITVRLGVSGRSHWKAMIADKQARANFAAQVAAAVSSLNLDGVDLDFEWANRPDEFENYSKLIVELRKTLGEASLFSVSLHPISYKITPSAILAVSYASLQCYGPSPIRFPYAQYTSNIQEVLAYGIPAQKLVPGLPFFGVSESQPRSVEGYASFVKAQLIGSAAQNNVVYDNREFVFNGQDMIARKTTFALHESLRGIMFWDLAIDVPVTNQQSLLKAITEAVEAQGN